MMRCLISLVVMAQRMVVVAVQVVDLSPISFITLTQLVSMSKVSGGTEQFNSTEVEVVLVVKWIKHSFLLLKNSLEMVKMAQPSKRVASEASLGLSASHARWVHLSITSVLVSASLATINQKILFMMTLLRAALNALISVSRVWKQLM